eukprot:1151067_1
MQGERGDIMYWHDMHIALSLDFMAKTQFNEKAMRHPLILSMLFLFFGVYTVFNITIEIFDDFHTHGFCGYSKWVAIPSYIAYKCCLYLILVNRIHEAFRESQYQVFTTKQLKIWAGVVIGWSVFNIILIWLTVTVHFEPDLVPKCHTSVGPPGLMAMALLDLVACGVNLYLFVKPVKELTKVIALFTDRNVSEHNQASMLKHVAVKQRVLSITAVSTTVIGMILIAMFSMEQILIGLDINLSTLSIILMYKWNNALATKLCCCCIKPFEDQLARAMEDRPSSQAASKAALGSKSQTSKTRSNKQELSKTDVETTVTQTEATITEAKTE